MAMKKIDALQERESGGEEGGDAIAAIMVSSIILVELQKAKSMQSDDFAPWGYVEEQTVKSFPFCRFFPLRSDCAGLRSILNVVPERMLR